MTSFYTIRALDNKLNKDEEVDNRDLERGLPDAPAPKAKAKAKAKTEAENKPNALCESPLRTVEQNKSTKATLKDYTSNLKGYTSKLQLVDKVVGVIQPLIKQQGPEACPKCGCFCLTKQSGVLNVFKKNCQNCEYKNYEKSWFKENMSKPLKL